MIKENQTYPFQDSEKFQLVKVIPTKLICEEYKLQLNIDVKRFFKGVDEIKVYKNHNSGLRFYFPFDVQGDDEFYQNLQNFNWYYIPWKWEHEIKSQICQPGDSILEIGSGNGGFIQQVNQTSIKSIVGLELNKSAVIKCQNLGLDVRLESIQEHSVKYFAKYDLVCSFQVLEHICDIESFIQSKIDCLKNGGRLLISVPNNDSFIKEDQLDILNMPPHHMTMWNRTSLSYLTEMYPLKLQFIKHEPLQPYHYRWFLRIKLNSMFSEKGFYYLNRIGMIYILERLMPILVKLFQIHGHTILAVFTKK